MQKINKLANAIVALALSCSVNAAEDLLPSEFTILVNHATNTGSSATATAISAGSPGND